MRFLLCLSLLLTVVTGISQDADSFVNAARAKQIISILASDSLKGRGNFTKEIEKAAIFIAGEFQKAGLKPFSQYTDYLEPFLFLEKQEPLERVVLNDQWLRTDEYVFISPFRFPPTLHLDGFAKKRLGDDINIASVSDSLEKWKDIDHPLLILLPKKKGLLKHFSSTIAQNNVRLLIEEPDALEQLSVHFKPELRKRMLFNVLGFLPGKTKPNELVLVTAHYDHVGYVPGRKADSVYNGANDNASGTASMMMLAELFAARSDNERSILFVAFAGEEIDLVGSRNLSAGLNTNNIVAVINLEMLGKPPKNERQACMVTGTGEVPNMFRKKAKKVGILIKEDHFPWQKLFSRSDNYPFALKGVPAHTFMMFAESDADYHQPSDEIETLDLENMAAVVKGLIGGIEELVNGKFTPKRNWIR